MMTSSNGNIFRVNGHLCGALTFYLICIWINGWVNNWGWWFETISCTLWRHCDDVGIFRNFLSICLHEWKTLKISKIQLWRITTYYRISYSSYILDFFLACLPWHVSQLKYIFAKVRPCHEVFLYRTWKLEARFSEIPIQRNRVLAKSALPSTTYPMHQTYMIIYA